MTVRTCKISEASSQRSRVCDMGHCVYVVENLLDGKKYVGYTHDADDRWREHQISSRRKRCRSYIHRAIANHGVENFKFYVIQECRSKEEGLAAEVEWIERLDTMRTGYNLTKGGEGCSHPWTSEQRAAQSKRLLGKTLSAETRAKISERGRERFANPDARLQQSIRCRQAFTEEMREHLSRINTGKKKSEETRRRMSAARRARNKSPVRE